MMNLDAKATDLTELRELFEHYSDNDRRISIKSLQTLAAHFHFPVSSSQIGEFFTRSESDDMDSKKNTITFIEFAQFVRHQEITLKKLFIFFDEKHASSDTVTVNTLVSDVEHFNSAHRLHYFWNVDTHWIALIFQHINDRRSVAASEAVKYGAFRKETLWGSTASLHLYYTLQSEIRDRDLRNSETAAAEEDIVTDDATTTTTDGKEEVELVQGIKTEDLRRVFKTLSRGKGFIDAKTLYRIVNEMKLPVSEHQLMQFFYQCDINEDGRIDFIEFCHFMHSQEQAIRQLFEQLDLDKTGYLTLDELQRSFHMKYLRENQGKLSPRLRADMHKIDDWVQRVVGTMHLNGTKAHNLKNVRIDYESFRTYAILSGSRNLLGMIQSMNHRNIMQMTTFIHDFDDIYLPHRASEDIGYVDQRQRNFLTLITFLSGTLAGVVSRTATAPIDRVKLLMQLKSHGSIGSHVNNIMQERSSGSLAYRMSAFWRGNLTNCIKMAPETAIKFTAHSMILRVLQTYSSTDDDDVDTRRYHLNFVSGAGAGAISQTLIYPLEIAKTRLALSQPGEYRDFTHVIRSIIRYEGVRSLYNGWIASVSGIVPYCAMEMGVFFTIKDKWHQRYGRNSEPDMFSLLAMGGTASISGTCLAYPFQLVRTKLQTQGMPGNKYAYRGLWDCFRSTWSKFGFFGLYSGIVPNFAKSIPATCISYVVVEKSKHLLKGFADFD